LGSYQTIFGWSNLSNTSFGIDLNLDTLAFYSYSSAFVLNLVTTQVFRDPSAWYHIVCVIDTTQATAANRAKIYINGSQVTALSTATYPAQNTSLNLATSTSWSIGRVASATTHYDGYMAEWNFIDGQALTPSSFGSTNTTTSVWQPAKYTGTYGTNGFYLKFSNIALTSGSNTGLGQDFSGNGNYWNTNNISVTAGTTYDAMTDVPTLTSATVANYATLNPLLQNSWWAAVNRGTIQDGNLTFASGGNTTAFSNFDLVGNSGKWYYEMTCSATDTSNTIVIAAQSRSTFEVGYYQSGLKQINGATPVAYGSSWTSGDVIGVAIDVPNNNITFYKNNTSQGVINNAFPSGQPVYVGAYYNTSSGSYAFNFGQRPFSYTPPSGYVAMNTYNLPTSTIVQGNKVMDATLYTGNLTGQSITNAAAFQPDLVWIKSRSAATDHKLTDSVRGATKALISDTTGAETTDLTGMTAFNTNGFTVGASTVYNNTSATYVGWQWQAGQGSSASNTDGTVTSTVSKNTTAGFSIVKYVNPASGSFTIGHGLGVAPKMIITKSTDTVSPWPTWFTGFTNGEYVNLNTTAAKASQTNYWGTAVPTSTVFGNTVGTTWNSGVTVIAYCWAEIAGFSKFGTYVGNGSTDGPFIYTGFRPKYVLIKCTTTAGEDWLVLDTARNTYNASTYYLYPDLSNAEGNATSYPVDLLSNGFKPRNTTGNSNDSGATYIYAAFAENPFKNALAR